MKLQLALDFTDSQQAAAMLEKVNPWFDVVEVGTPLIKAEGMRAVAKMKAAVPDKWILADMKTMDAGDLEANLAFDAGADMVTVLAAASDITIRNAVLAAEKRQKKVIVDLIGMKDKLRRASEMVELGVHYLGVHSGYDEQSQGGDPLSALRELSAQTTMPLVVAGGIGLHNMAPIAACRPDIIVVGSQITAAKQPSETAKAIRGALHQFLEGGQTI
ncbi:3-hexulose-6-phosphate synthase [Cohnella terricola]|uniref:3-hexulose-6-phosphate synthase n=1 Tax=Cohnella terricola TaxID=1289167 RepID=A0A559J919_9BACL|nr:3-hexulose-6-phosphate synthase [Cohnella terricola]